MSARRGRSGVQSREREIGQLFARQRDVAHVRQLAARGLGADAVDYRVACGRLHPVQHGVVSLGATLRPLAAETAALLAYGNGAITGAEAISHGSCAAELQIGKRPALVHVTTPRALRSRPGTKVHKARLEPNDIRWRHGLPFTSPLRTLLDLAPLLDQPTLRRAINEAKVLNLVTDLEIAAYTRSNAGAKGVARLRAAHQGPGGYTRSEGERRLAALLIRAGLHPTHLNGRTLGFRGDIVFEDEKVIVEYDPPHTHDNELRFVTDRDRDGELEARGWLVHRVTSTQLRDAPAKVVARIAAILARRSPS